MWGVVSFSLVDLRGSNKKRAGATGGAPAAFEDRRQYEREALQARVEGLSAVQAQIGPLGAYYLVDEELLAEAGLSEWQQDAVRYAVAFFNQQPVEVREALSGLSTGHMERFDTREDEQAALKERLSAWLEANPGVANAAEVPARVTALVNGTRLSDSGWWGCRLQFGAEAARALVWLLRDGAGGIDGLVASVAVPLSVKLPVLAGLAAFLRSGAVVSAWLAERFVEPNLDGESGVDLKLTLWVFPRAEKRAAAAGASAA